MSDAKEVLEHLEKKPEFKVGDRVYVEHLDEFGTVTGYVPGQPICVSVLLDINESFGKTLGFNEKELQLVDKAFTDKWISNIRDGLKGCLEAMKKPKFTAGDDVYCNKYGNGVVRRRVAIESTVNGKPQDVRYVIAVKFDTWKNEVMYSEDGKTPGIFINSDPEAYVLHHGKTGKEPLCKPKQSPINPSHYRVEGIPEAIDIMRGLMTDEQLEGFLWGNIIKYVYRYGRKGDKKETAGKIKWYAEKLAVLNAKELKI